MRTSAPLVAILSATALTLTACSGGSTDTSDQSASNGDLVAIITTTPLGSVVSQIAACGGGTATTIMGPGDDPHSFEPSSKQVAEMVEAPLVVISGLGLEEGILSAIESASEDGANILDVGSQIDPLTFGGETYTGTTEDHDHESEEGHDDESEEEHTHAAEDPDPHWWLDVNRTATAATIVGDALAESTGDDAYATCGQQMSEELTALDAEVAETLSTVPEANRKLVTDHKAFQYFGDRYGFTMVGTVVPSGSTEGEPSSEDLAELVKTIEAEQVPAIFTNSTISSTLPEAVAAEVGYDVQIVSLYVGSTGPEGSGAETYQDMMRADAQLIADALQ